MSNASTAIANMDLPKVILAIGSLGTAAYGVVDAIKCLGGGISNSGFAYIRKTVTPFFPSLGQTRGALELSSVLDTLRANWLNGMSLADQKSVAKALIKLNLDANTASAMASAAGVSSADLVAVAGKLPKAGTTEGTLTDGETNAYGRFDLLVSALLDQGYQRADQFYRNSAKLLAVPVAVILAVLGAWALDGANFDCAEAGKAIVGGLLATPLAPIAKDLSTAIQASAQLAQSWKPVKR